MREALGFENLLTFKQTVGIALKPLDEGLTGWQWIQAGTQPGSNGAALGTARWRQLEHPIGPGEQAVHMHKAGFGAHARRHQTRQKRLLELSRDPTTGRHKALEGRMMLVVTLEHAGRGV